MYACCLQDIQYCPKRLGLRCLGVLQDSLVQTAYHVSVSRVVPIRYHEIEPLLLSLEEYLTSTKRCARYHHHLNLLSSRGCSS